MTDPSTGDVFEENTVEEKLAKKLRQALSKIDRPGSFCVGGSVPFVLPGLEVRDLGPIGLPLTAAQAELLKDRCQQAPYGKGTETLVDTNVRRVWRLEPDQLALTNPEWETLVQGVVRTVQKELGLEKQKLTSHLYDLLLYEPGSFFLPHKDGEKADRMVATLVLALPSHFEGGELVVRHEGQEQTLDLGGRADSQFRVHFAAFYADCEHEVRPLRSGYRLCLVYNLTLAKAKKAITAPRDSEQLDTLTEVLSEWTTDTEELKLVVTLDHQYTKDGLSWDTLKGADRAKARVLCAAAQRAGCKAYLALLTFWESGSAEETGGYGYGRRGRWSRDYEEEEDSGPHQMGEVFDSSLTAEQLTDADGQGLPLPSLTVEKEELLDPDALLKVDPEEEFEGYTGNAGMTLERWYRHAAIILWPQRRHFEVLCDADSRRIVPVLSQMVTAWQRAAPEEAVALKAQCLDLAAALLRNWPAQPHSYGYAPVREKPEEADLLKLLGILGDVKLIGTFLGEVMLKDVAVDPGRSIVTVCREHGWKTFQRELLALFRSTTVHSLERHVRLLEHICSARGPTKDGWLELCEALSQETVSALETLDRDQTPNNWQARSLKRAELLAGLARALLLTDQEKLLARVVNHVLAIPDKYPLLTVHMSVFHDLAPWLKKHVKRPSAALSQWVASCRAQLEALTAKAPQRPRDFRRAAAISCRCADCGQLRRFLEDPREQVYRFRARQDQRSHLENAIRVAHCDLDCKTERTGSPHVLVCTKNTASFEAAVKKYHQDLKHLETLQELATELGLK